MKYDQDRRTVLTLDAGGTNFVFSAIRGNREITEAISLPARGDDLKACLESIVTGFANLIAKIDVNPAAISFAFPGPADYPNGIIGDLCNLPAFRGGVAIGPMLEEHFNLPVFINNDGDLFSLGEAVAGFLPDINQRLSEAGSPKSYRNLFGITLGTGFGAGIVRDGNLFLGDNSAAAEIWLMRNKLDREFNAEEGVSIRAIRRVYAEQANIPLDESPDPRDIFKIASDELPGDKNAAREAFRRMGEIAGDALADAMTLVDGLVVIGGGLAGAHSLFLSTVIEEMNSKFKTFSGDLIPRMEMRAFNLEVPAELDKFLKGEVYKIGVPGSDKRVPYDALKRLGLGISRLGASRAIAVGAYTFALNALD